MGILDFFKKGNRAEIEERILLHDGGSIEWEELKAFLDSRGISEEEYQKIRTEAHHKKADDGNVTSQYMYALLIEGKNNDESLRYYTMAANSGYIPAMESLATAYSEYCNGEYSIGGRGFGCNPKEELRWRRKAAESGSLRSMCQMGLEYSIGSIVEQNYEEAEKWYTKAANAGSGEAYNGLARLPKYAGSAEKSIELYRKALKASNNDEDAFQSAAYSLGWAYLPRENNPYSDAKKSAYFFALSYVLGNNTAKDGIQRTGYIIPDQEWKSWVEDAIAHRSRM